MSQIYYIDTVGNKYKPQLIIFMQVRQIKNFVETNLRLYLDFGSSKENSLVGFLNVPIDIVKSELTLWPGIIKWDLCDELNKSGLSSNLLIHLFQRLTELMK